MSWQPYKVARKRKVGKLPYRSQMYGECSAKDVALLRKLSPAQSSLKYLKKIDRSKRKSGFAV